MDSHNPQAMWDMALSPSLPALADDDFIALLQRQFSAISSKTAPDSAVNVNPQSLSRPQQQELEATPPSDPDSLSPSSVAEDTSAHSRQNSVAYADERTTQSNSKDDDQGIKRKASKEDLEDEPNLKSQHTSPSKKAPPATRRKSTGNPPADESRLLKRKEQNRAAQRAFRERKEKHVKDLEDKVAALEEKTSNAVAENESLREVITRLQNENVRLREAQFTFSVPGSARQVPKDGSARSSPPRERQELPRNLFSVQPSASTSTSGSSHSSPQSIFTNDKAHDALSFLGPDLTVIPAERTATADAMNMDFGFGPVSTTVPYTTIASNPLFMTFRDPEPLDQSLARSQPYAPAHQAYDFAQQMFPGWPDLAVDSNMQEMHAFDLTNSLDELFGASYDNQGLDLFNTCEPSPHPNISPVPHRNPKSPEFSVRSSGSSPQAMPLNAGDSTAPFNANEGGCGTGNKCTKENLAKHIALDSGSVFVTRTSLSSAGDSTPSPATPQSSRKEDNSPEIPPCKGLKLPKTQKSDKNVEVMSAWRSIQRDPNYRDIDVNQLCSEFAAKAKCDGTQVVIEPSGMEEILERVNASRKARQQQRQANLFSFSTSSTGISQLQ